MGHGCNMSFGLYPGSPLANGMRFCPYCGRHLVERQSPAPNGDAARTIGDTIAWPLSEIIDIDEQIAAGAPQEQLSALKARRDALELKVIASMAEIGVTQIRLPQHTVSVRDLSASQDMVCKQYLYFQRNRR
jgi:hypothetical protein